MCPIFYSENSTDLQLLRFILDTLDLWKRLMTVRISQKGKENNR